MHLPTLILFFPVFEVHIFVQFELSPSVIVQSVSWIREFSMCLKCVHTSEIKKAL